MDKDLGAGFCLLMSMDWFEGQITGTPHILNDEQGYHHDFGNDKISQRVSNRETSNIHTWWIIPQIVSRYISRYVRGRSRVNPLVTGVNYSLVSGMSHQVRLVKEYHPSTNLPLRWVRQKPSPYLVTIALVALIKYSIMLIGTV